VCVCLGLDGAAVRGPFKVSGERGGEVIRDPLGLRLGGAGLDYLRVTCSHNNLECVSVYLTGGECDSVHRVCVCVFVCVSIPLIYGKGYKKPNNHDREF